MHINHEQIQKTHSKAVDSMEHTSPKVPATQNVNNARSKMVQCCKCNVWQHELMCQNCTDNYMITQNPFRIFRHRYSQVFLHQNSY